MLISRLSEDTEDEKTGKKVGNVYLGARAAVDAW